MRPPASPRWSSALVAALLLAATAPVAASSLDVTLIRQILRGAAPAIQRCAAEHALPAGGYTVVITVFAGGATEAALTRSPAAVSSPGAACVRAAYAAVRVPRIGAGAREIRVTWPFGLP